jgi:hypothetical protein
MRAVTFALLLALATLATADFAWAQAQPAGSPAEADYERHMDNGVKLYKEGDTSAALAEFDAAYRARPRASPLVNKALCYKKLRRYADAIAALEQALGAHTETLDERHKAAAEKEAAELRALVAWVVVTINPPSALLLVDNEGGEYEPRREADGSVALAPGPNRLRAVADGFAPAVQTVTLVAGRANQPVALALVVTDGEVEVHAAAGASIEIDGRERGHGQFVGRFDPGVHAVTVRNAGRARTLQIIVTAGKRALVIEQADGTLASDAKASGSDTPVPAPEPPTYRGFFLLASAGILTIVNRPEDFVRNDNAQAGYMFGGIGGYRVAKWAAFQGVAQYSDVRIHGVFGTSTAANQAFLVRGGRLGAALRVMLPGDKWVRFVGTLGGGVAIDRLTFQNAPGVPPYEGRFGADVYGQIDLLLEFELSHVLIDIGAQHHAESSKHFSSDDGTNAFMERPLLTIGPKLEVGYAFW